MLQKIILNFAQDDFTITYKKTKFFLRWFSPSTTASRHGTQGARLTGHVILSEELSEELSH